MTNYSSELDPASKPKKAKSKAKGGQQVAAERRDQPLANRDKWVDVDNDLVPPSIPIWTVALRAVDKDQNHIRPDLPQSEKGYAFPDPNSLVGHSPEVRAKKLCTWLGLRPAVCAQSFVDAGRKPPFAPAAVWRSVMTVNSKTVLPACGSTAEKATKASKIKEAVQHLFGDELTARLQGGLAAVYWHETALQVQDDAIVALDKRVVQEIIWELFEHNFRFELLALDLIAAPQEWNDVERRVKRHGMIEIVCSAIDKGILNLWHESFPEHNFGLAAECYEDRVASLECLSELELSWPNAPTWTNQSFFTVFEERGLDGFASFELEVVLFYCQTFFDFFGRPPIVPHRLPISKAGATST